MAKKRRLSFAGELNMTIAMMEKRHRINRIKFILLALWLLVISAIILVDKVML